jgi:hypothetical protein
MTNRSVVRDEDLQLLVNRGLLPPKKLGNWNSVYQKPFPSENTSDTIVYTSFFERSLGLPVSKFLRGLLFFYKIELYHLNPNGIFQIALFVHMCEAFLGINPHFQLFRYFFCLKPFPDSNDPNVCGGAGVQIRQGKKNEYFQVSLKDPGRKWREQWFVIGNKVSQQPERTPCKPVYSDKWNSSPDDRESSGIPELVKMIAELKKKGLTAVGIAQSLISRRVQPLQERSVPGYRYKGEGDLNHDEILERLAQLFVPCVNFKSKIPDEYSADNPPPAVSP